MGEAKQRSRVTPPQPKVWCKTCDDKGRVYDPDIVAEAKRKGHDLAMGAAIVPCPSCPGTITIPKLAFDHLTTLAYGGPQ